MTTQNSTSLGGKQSGKVLIVDTESMLCELLQFRFEKEGFQTTVMNDGKRALATDLSDYSLILVDLMDRPFNGLQFTEEVKNNPDTVGIPIIIMSAKASEDDIVDGLDAGADDYIAKPYSIKNVLARIAAVLRRCKPKPVSDIVCNRSTLVCTVDGKAIRLPRKEFELLALFLEHPGRIFTREELLDRIWPENTFIADRSIDVHITRLRGKIAPYGKNIITRSGYGYGWQD